MSNYHTLQLLRAYSVGEVEAQRAIRRYMRSLGRKISKNHNRREEFTDLLGDAASRSCYLARELRANHLLKGFLKGHDYRTVEQKTKPNTLKIDKLLKSVSLPEFYDFDEEAFLEWAGQ